MYGITNMDKDVPKIRKSHDEDFECDCKWMKYWLGYDVDNE